MEHQVHKVLYKSYRLDVQNIKIMMLKYLILLLFNYMPWYSNTPDLLEKSNEAVIEILGNDIFTKYVKIDSSLTKFYMEDSSYDNLESYDKSINYKYASVEYTLHEEVP